MHQNDMVLKFLGPELNAPSNLTQNNWPTLNSGLHTLLLFPVLYKTGQSLRTYDYTLHPFMPLSNCLLDTEACVTLSSGTPQGASSLYFQAEALGGAPTSCIQPRHLNQESLIRMRP